jgi:hypothetical protein
MKNIREMAIPRLLKIIYDNVWFVKPTNLKRQLKLQVVYFCHLIELNINRQASFYCHPE